MVNFDYQTPTRLIFGKGVVAEKLQRVMAQFGQRVLLTYGGGSIKRSGLYQQVKDLLADKQIFELPGIEPNPKFNPSVLDGVKICKERCAHLQGAAHRCDTCCGWRFGARLHQGHSRRGLF